MDTKLTEHPLVIYLTFVMPLILLIIGIIVNAGIFPLLILLAWIGTAFVVLFLPMASDNGSSS